MALEPDVRLREPERLARRDAQLLLDQVEPVTASVTGCSTWSRALTSRKKNAPSSSSRNSTVPALA